MGTQLPSTKRGKAPPPIFGPCLLSPNSWIDQDEICDAGRPQPWPHCVRRGPISISPKGHSPQFSAHICCGQMAGWIKMPFGMEVGLGTGDFVLDGDWGPSFPSPKRGKSPPIFGPCLLWPNSWMDQDATWSKGRSWPIPHCVSPSRPRKGHSSSLPLFVSCLLWPQSPTSAAAELLWFFKCSSWLL